MSVFRVATLWGNDMTTETERPGMAAAGAAAARAARQWPGEQGSAGGRQRHPVALGHWRGVARSAGAVWPLAERAHPLAGLAPGGCGTRRSRRSNARRTLRATWIGRCSASTAPSCAPTSTRPGPRGDSGAEALGRSPGGFSTRVRLKSEGNGKPLTVLFTLGQRHEAPVCPRVLAAGVIRRRGVAGSACARSASLATRATEAAPSGRCAGVTASAIRSLTPAAAPFDRAVPRLRRKVENCIARCKPFRTTATRYDKRGESYRAVWVIAMTIVWLRHAP